MFCGEISHLKLLFATWGDFEEIFFLTNPLTAWKDREEWGMIWQEVGYVLR